MNLSNLTSGGEKPWLAINANSIDCTLGTGVKTGLINFLNLPLVPSPLPDYTIMVCDSNDDGRPTINNGTDVHALAYVSEVPTTSQLTSEIIYRQGAISSGNVYGTWAEVDSLIIEKEGAITICVDDSIVSPCVVSTTINCKQKTIFIGSFGPQLSKLRILDNNALINPRRFSSLNLQLSSLTTPNLIFDDGCVLELFEGTRLTTIDAIVPNISILDGASLVFALDKGNQINNGGLPMINLGIGSSFIFAIFENSAGLTVNNLVTSVDASSNLVLVRDCSFSVSDFVNVGFLGTFIDAPVSKSLNITYDDSATPVLGSTNVQGALDGVKQQLTFNGFQAQYLGIGITIPIGGGSTSICNTLLLGSGYDVGTFTYTIPVKGIYEISYIINWKWTSTINPAHLRVDSNFDILDGIGSVAGYQISELYANVGVSQEFSGTNAATLYKQFNSGATIQIELDNLATANDLIIYANDSFFSARLIQAT